MKEFAPSQLDTGIHNVLWRVDSQLGKLLGAGVYLVRVQIGSDVKTIRVVKQ